MKQHPGRRLDAQTFKNFWFLQWQFNQLPNVVHSFPQATNGLVIFWLFRRWRIWAWRRKMSIILIIWVVIKVCPIRLIAKTFFPLFRGSIPQLWEVLHQLRKALKEHFEWVIWWPSLVVVLTHYETFDLEIDQLSLKIVEPVLWPKKCVFNTKHTKFRNKNEISNNVESQFCSDVLCAPWSMFQ